MNKQAWIECALRQGMDSFEIYQSSTGERNVTWYQGNLDTFTTSRVLGTSLRGIYQHKMANMAFEKIEDEQMEDIIALLKEQAQTISADEEDKIRTPEPFTSVHKENKWVSASMETIKDVLASVEKKLLDYDPRVLQVNELSYQEGTGSRSITNSLGLDVHDDDRMNAIAAYIAVGEGNDIQVNYEVQIVEDLSAFDQDAFVKKVCDKALSKCGATPIPSNTIPVILEKEAMTMLFSAFTGLFNGEMIYKGISCIKDKQGKKIFSNKITIEDDPRNTDALSVANFDDEGCPTRKKVLVDQGVFVQALHSTKSAMRMHTESTGNGFKGSYAGTIGVSPMNCCIKPGEKSLDELCALMQNGLIIDDLQGLHAGINFVTTDFSLQASGYLVKDGKKDRRVNLITIAGNFMDLMKNVVEVGSDLEWSYHQVVSPSIYFKKCAISGE